MKLTVSRLEAYPADEPTGRAVGFVVECSNGRSFYVDTVVSFQDAGTDEESLDKALEVLGDNINAQCEALEAKSALVGEDVTDRLVTSDDDDVAADDVDDSDDVVADNA